jgi:hypothetical protein
MDTANIFANVSPENDRRLRQIVAHIRKDMPQFIKHNGLVREVCADALQAVITASRPLYEETEKVTGYDPFDIYRNGEEGVKRVNPTVLRAYSGICGLPKQTGSWANYAVVLADWIEARLPKTQ